MLCTHETHARDDLLDEKYILMELKYFFVINKLNKMNTSTNWPINTTSAKFAHQSHVSPYKKKTEEIPQS